MIDNIFISLINNAALLLSLGIIYDLLYRENRETLPVLNKITSGIIIGVIAIVLMATPAKWETGIIFDTRTILLGLTGLFFGTIPALLSMTIAGAYRITLGGGGALMGVATILTSGLAGLAWKRYRFRESTELSLSELYLFGVAVHAIMILCMFLLPQEVIQKTINTLALPVIIIYPVGTALLGNLLNGRRRRYRMEEELQDSMSRFSQLAEQSRTVTWEVDADGLYTYVSPMAESVFGYRPEELVGKQHFYDIHPEKGRAEFKEAAFAIINSKVDCKDLINPVQAKDGRIIWVATNGLPLLARDGSLKGFRGSDKDITERQLAEEALKESEQNYSRLLETANEGIWVIDQNSITTFVNERLTEMLGYRAEEMIGQSLDSFVFPEDLPDHAERMQRRRRGEKEVYERRYRKKNGQALWSLSSSAPLMTPTGQFSGGFAMITDITEHKKAEEAISSASQRLRLHYAQSPLAMIEWDMDFRVALWNPAAESIFGFTEKEAMGQHASFILTDAVRPHVHNVWDALLRNSGGYRSTNENMRSDGTVIFCEWYNTPLVNTEGIVIGVSSLVQDITEKQKLEGQLRQAQKMESIGTFAGGIAHDFNNILTAIMGYGNIALMKMAKDDPQRQNIEHMLEASGRAAHLTQDLLLFSRKQISERKPVDLNDIIGKVEKFLVRVIGEDVDCRTALSAEPMPILGDAHQLEQVLMNLATNARDAMSFGGTFTVTTESVTFNKEFVSVNGYGKPGRYVLATISDTGKGMDAATREHVFDPFFTTKEIGKGTGLGLSVVYGIIDQHEGFITVYSEPGQGTTFKIYLPLISTNVEKEIKLEEDRPRGGTETILLAEDNETVRDLTRTVLESFGYTVITAVDGQDAVNAYRSNQDRIKLLLFDIIMPKKTGKEAYDEIRTIKPDIKVLFQSGYAPDLVRQKVLLDDNASVVFKPVSPMVLLRQVRSVLDQVK